MAVTSETDSVVDPLQSLLAAHDVRCPGCGYNLRGSAGTCAECGTVMTLDELLRERNAEERQRSERADLAWIATAMTGWLLAVIILAAFVVLLGGAL